MAIHAIPHATGTRKRRGSLTPLLFLFPAAITISILTLLPIIYSI